MLLRQLVSSAFSNFRRNKIPTFVDSHLIRRGNKARGRPGNCKAKPTQAALERINDLLAAEIELFGGGAAACLRLAGHSFLIRDSLSAVTCDKGIKGDLSV